ncbi:hypothetical protein LJC09_02925 [Desulfovibrio sp. OttesenSCG-928-F20]|nr:hypothetical protein [Desulfovibrio sp. OttesenSCG-928-F20]
MKRFFSIPFVFFSLVLLAGCVTARGVQEHVWFDPTGKITVYQDQWVQRNPPELHVQPASAPPMDMRVLFIPFRVTQPIDNPTILGYSTARTFWQTWLTMRLFPGLEFSGDDTPYRRDRAVQLARARGADMVVGGFVTYVYAGGTAGDSQIAVQVEAHDTRTGQMVWSMAQSGLLPAARTTDYFIFAAKQRLPSDPLHAISQALAADMGKQIQNWTSGPSVPTKMQQYDQKTHDVFFGPADPVPAPREPKQDEDVPYTDTKGGAFP